MPHVPTTIETSRLVLRPMDASDLDSLLLIFTDPAVLAAFEVPPLTREQMTAWMERNLDHQGRYGYGLYSVLLRTTGELIGDCGLEHMHSDGRAIVELGYDFRSAYWNQGYATEAATAVRDHAFQQLRLARLNSLIRQRNRASQRVAEKIGMQRVGELVRHGEPYWLYEITRESLLARAGFNV